MQLNTHLDYEKKKRAQHGSTSVLSMDEKGGITGTKKSHLTFVCGSCFPFVLFCRSLLFYILFKTFFVVIQVAASI